MKTAIWAAAMAAMAMPAGAATVTVDFDEAVTLDDTGYVTTLLDRGFVTKTTNINWDGGYISLHDGGGITRTIIQREDHAAFTPVGIDLVVESRFERAGDDPWPGDDAEGDVIDAWAIAGLKPRASYRIIGWKADGTTVSLDGVADGPDAKTAGLHFGEAFRDVTEIGFEIMYPLGTAVDGVLAPGIALFDTWDVTTPGQVWCMEYCASIVLDNFVVQPSVAAVPLPAGAVLLGGALAMLGAARRLRKGAIRPI